MNDTSHRATRTMTRSMLVAIVIGVAVLGWLFGPRLLLAGQFYLATQSGMADMDRVTSDDLNALVGYAPQRIAVYLDSSNERWRAVACRVLATQLANGTEGNWEGIAPAMARFLLRTTDPVITRLGVKTLQTLPSISDTDIAAILASLRDAAPSASRRTVFGIAMDKRGNAGEECHELLHAWADSSVPADRADATALLARYFPDDARIGALVKEAANEWPNETEAAPVIAAAAATRPQLIPELLRGSSKEQRIAIRVLSQPGPAAAAAVSDDVIRVAIGMLRAPDADSATVAERFLGRQVQAGHVLVGELPGADATAKLKSLGLLRQMTANATRRNDGSFRFTKEEAENLVALLTDESPEVRSAAAEVIDAGMPASEAAKGLFEPGTGPLDPAHAEAFRRLLAAPSGELDSLALKYFDRVVPFQESDIAGIAGAVRRIDENKRANGNAQTPASERANLAFAALLQRFPEQPATMTLAREKFAASTNLDDPDVQAAATHLLGVAADRREVLEGIVERYHATRVPEPDSRQRATTERLAKLILMQAASDQNSIDSQVVQEAVTDLLPQLWLMGSRLNDVPGGDRVPSMLSPDALASCERAALRRCLESRVFSKQMLVQPSSVAQCVQAIQAVPGFSEEATTAATRALDSDDVDARMRAFYLIGAGRLDSPALRERVVASLNDPNVKIQAAAVDVLGSLGAKDAGVIDELRRLVKSKQPDLVRAAAVRNLALLSPDDPETVKLIESLADSGEFAIRTEARQALRKGTGDRGQGTEGRE
jgi:hypothetical protein